MTSIPPAGSETDIIQAVFGALRTLAANEAQIMVNSQVFGSDVGISTAQIESIRETRLRTLDTYGSYRIQLDEALQRGGFAGLPWETLEKWREDRAAAKAAEPAVEEPEKPQRRPRRTKAQIAADKAAAEATAAAAANPQPPAEDVASAEDAVADGSTSDQPAEDQVGEEPLAEGPSPDWATATFEPPAELVIPDSPTAEEPVLTPS